MGVAIKSILAIFEFQNLVLIINLSQIIILMKTRSF